MDILTPDYQVGQVEIIDESLIIGTHRGAVNNNEMFPPEQNRDSITSFIPDAIEGSKVEWLVDGTEYIVSGQLFSQERSPGQDSFGYWFDNGEYQEIATTADLPLIPGIGRVMDFEITIPVVDGKLSLGVWDTGDAWGTSTIKIDTIAPLEQQSDTPVESDSLLNYVPSPEDFDTGSRVENELNFIGSDSFGGTLEIVGELPSTNSVLVGGGDLNQLSGVWIHSETLEAIRLDVEFQPDQAMIAYDW